MGDLRRRTLTALVYGAVVLVAILAPPAVLWVALAALGVLGLAELAALRAGLVKPLLAILFVAGLVSLGVLRSWGPLGAHHGVAGELPVWIFAVLVPTWAADIAAYLVGSAFGRRKLAPAISPGKTWEGTLAGFAASAVVALGVGALFGLPRPLVAILAVTVGPIGLAGDLFESYVKRRAGVKDSGTLLPGHGGVLDRLDSTVAVAPFVVACVWLASAGALGGLG
jgi:phosphatidate cytidylyltransferase